MIRMMMLITYDVNTTNSAGRKRLRKVAKYCVNYGQRVQNSVFECVADAALMVRIKKDLVSMIDPSVDSLRFYSLGSSYRSKVEHYGAKPSYDAEGFLAL